MNRGHSTVHGWRPLVGGRPEPIIPGQAEMYAVSDCRTPIEVVSMPSPTGEGSLVVKYTAA